VIEGVDVALAVERTGGNQARYERFLRRFAEQQADGAAPIRAALAAGDRATAERAAHSLKGSAGNLGIAALAQAAAQVESAIKAGGPADELISALETTLCSAVDAIRRALPEEAALIPATNGHVDPAALREPLSLLRKLLAHDDAEATETLAAARSALAGALTTEELAGLGEAVESYDFAAALSRLDAVTTRLGITLEQES
jgi:HPt (histidine-containing phosphotransfer) domain-containing protein